MTSGSRLQVTVDHNCTSGAVGAGEQGAVQAIPDRAALEIPGDPEPNHRAMHSRTCR